MLISAAASSKTVRIHDIKKRRHMMPMPRLAEAGQRLAELVVMDGSIDAVKIRYR